MPKAALGSILPKAVSSLLRVSLLFNWYPEFAAHSIFFPYLDHAHIQKRAYEINGAYVTRMGTPSGARGWAVV